MFEGIAEINLVVPQAKKRLKTDLSTFLLVLVDE